MKTSKYILHCIAILGLAAATPLYSTTTEFSTRSSWLAAVSGVTTTDFDTAISGYTPPAPDGLAVYIASGGITFDGTLFQGFNGASEGPIRFINGGASQFYYNWGSGVMLQGDSYAGALAHLHLTLPTAVFAWGTDLMTNSPNGATFTVQVGGASCASLSCSAPTFTNPTRAFYGMTSTTAFTFVDLYYPSNAFGEIDNFSTATGLASGGGGDGEPPVGDAPEIGTIILCATGLIALARARKLRAFTPATA